MLENQTTTNRVAIITELESLQSQISAIQPVSSYRVGDVYDGYIIGAIYSYDGSDYAIILSPGNSSDGIAWSNIGSSASTALSTWDGLDNSDKITKQSGFTNGAAKSALTYAEGGFEDWYLGAVDEWLEISKNLLVVNRALENESFAIISPLSFLWTSTEAVEEPEKGYYFGVNSIQSYTITTSTKNTTYAVRPIRTVQL